MSRAIWLGLSIFASAPLFGCGGDSATPPRGAAGNTSAGGNAGSGNGGNAPTAGTSPNGGNGTGGASGGTAPIGDPTKECAAPDKGAPLLRRLASRELSRALEDIFPEAKGKWSTSLTTDLISHRGFDNDADVLVVGKQTADQITDTAKAVADAITGDALNQVLPCAASSPGASCAGEFLSKYGKRLFRRALTPAETTSYTEFFTLAASKTDFKQGLGWLIRGLIESPNFLYRRELGAVAGGVRQLTQHEIATELAFTFGGTTPSDALLAQADRGELATPEQRTQVAKTLLSSAGGREVIQTLFNSIFGYSRVTSVAKTNVSEFAAQRDEMVQETRRFIEEVVVNKAGGPKELLTAAYSTPSSKLASFYGWPAPSSDYAVTQRPSGRGVGILAQGSVLASRALPNGSSPTKRGLLVFEKLLCREPDPVPPSIPMLPEPKAGVTTRERYETQHAAGGCQVCHSKFDPIGFGFEHFNEAGQFREKELVPGSNQALDINATGTVKDDAGTAFTFDGLEQLAMQLAQMPEVYSCMSGDVSAFAFGTTESCLAQTRRAEFVSGKLSFVDYLTSLAAEPHFTQRSP
ncbi:MAG TPA: DUF1588 domain-containing protein [Polyangiaceae bacterium]|nr:DUF1588 domain-containing protein [Polyangiaceae bacterium]